MAVLLSGSVSPLNLNYMTERQKQIQFLKTLIHREESTECHAICEKIHRAEREERYLRRMIFLLIVLMLLSLASLSYATLFWPEYFRDRSQFLLRVSSSLGLASLICLLVFTGYWLWQRLLLNALYNECRRLV